MELKIQCGCGSRYKFDVEPVDGRVPAPLSCPNCQASWTEVANSMIADTLAASTQSQPAAAAAAPISSSAPPPPAVPPPARMGLRLSSHAAPPEAEAPALAAAPASEAAPEPVAAPRRAPRVPTLDPLVEQYDTGQFGRGFLGAAAGAFLGGLAFYLLFAHTGVRLKIIALGVGFLAGMGARLLGKDRSKELAIIGALLSIVMIVGAQYLVTSKWFHEGEGHEDGQPPKSDYDERVAEAQKVMAAMPNGTEQEIRLYLAREQADEGEKPDPKSVDPDEIRQFRAEEFPRYRKLADGTLTREAYEKEREQELAMTAEQRKEDREIGERVFKVVFLAFVLSKFNLVCMAGSAGLAYKMIADA